MSLPGTLPVKSQDDDANELVRSHIFDEFGLPREGGGLALARFRFDVQSGASSFFRQLPPEIIIIIETFLRHPDGFTYLDTQDYINPIADHFFRVETKYMPRHYMNRQREISAQMRTILIDWLVDVHRHFRCVSNNVTWLCINTLDRFLELEQVSREKLQLVGCVAMLIACKYEEFRPRGISSFVRVCDYAYTAEDFVQTEKIMITTLQHKLADCTAEFFIRRFVKIAGGCIKMLNLTSYFAERTMQEYDFIKYRPSIIAAAALCLAMKTLNCQPQSTCNHHWTQQLERYTTYSETSILPCVLDILRVAKLSKTGQVQHNFVYRKYCNERYKFVAQMQLPDEWNTAQPPIARDLHRPSLSLFPPCTPCPECPNLWTNDMFFHKGSINLREIDFLNYSAGIDAVGFTIHTATDRRTGGMVTIKIIDLCKKDIPFYALREASFLKSLKHTNIVSLVNVIQHDWKMFLICELLDQDLRQYMDRTAGDLDPQLVLSFLRQILDGVAFCHSSGIVHRWLQSKSIYVNAAGVIKLANFDFARAFFPARAFTPHKMNFDLWYKAPEILLGLETFVPDADIWSVGVIFVELLTKRAPFCGESEIDQIFKIFRMKGTPNPTTWPGCTRLPAFKSATFPQWPQRRITSVMNLESRIGKHGVDLCEKMLAYNPEDRISSRESLRHPYFGAETSYPSALSDANRCRGCGKYCSASSNKRAKCH